MDYTRLEAGLQLSALGLALVLPWLAIILL